MEIAFVGGSESVLGFNLAGVKKSYAANTEDEMISKINEVMADSGVGRSLEERKPDFLLNS